MKNWQCPYCGHLQILSEGKNLKTKYELREIVQTSEHEWISFQVKSIACLNELCKKLSLKFLLKKSNEHNYSAGSMLLFGKKIQEWRLLPDSIAKPQPDYIPEFVKKDYEEACKIAHLSPNASAVLARRCLQSMLRDFCKIKKSTLHKEIEELKKKVNERSIPGVTEESIRSIDSIRKMGNIGAHMEKPTGMLIDIEPNEAHLLIRLIEALFNDWYVTRYDRQQRLKNIQAMTTKKEQKKSVNKQDVNQNLKKSNGV